jgi:hypothetical protein
MNFLTKPGKVVRTRKRRMKLERDPLGGGNGYY